MKFYNDEHQSAFLSLVNRMRADSCSVTLDVYKISLAYLITLDNVCRNHIDSIYDFEDDCIIPECLSEGWQTGTSRRTLLLAFNLFTGNTLWLPDDDIRDCTPSDLFSYSGSYLPYYLIAVELRFSENFPEPFYINL